MKQTTMRSWKRFRLPGLMAESAMEEEGASPMPGSSLPATGTFLEADTLFEGDLKLSGDFRVDNDFRGDLTVDGTLLVGPSGSVEGNLSARQVEIEGAVVGNVKARRMCVLRASGRLHGDVETACFEIERHAFFQGGTKMTRPLAAYAPRET